MHEFIKLIDELYWKAFLIGWTPPTKKDESGNEVPKSELD